MSRLEARPESIDITRAQSAMVVVDIQNAFAAKCGMFDLAGLDISGAAAVIETNRRLLDAARAAGVRVVYLRMTYKADLSDAGGPLSPNYHKELAMNLMRSRSELDGKLLVENSWDWQIVDELTPQQGDQVFNKPRYSGFCGTSLDNYLRAENIRYLFFTGIATNICVESTVRDAYFHEYWPIMIEDAMNHSGPDFNRQAALWSFEHVFGWVANSASVIKALGA